MASRRYFTVWDRTLGLLSAAMVVLVSTAFAADGDLDTTFNGDGKLITDFGGFGGADGAGDVLIQPDGKIVIGGRTREGDLARYDAGGTLDPTFGGDGSSAFSGVAFAAMALQADGKIVIVGGDVGIGTGVDFAVARFNSDGSLDDGSANDATPGDSFGTGFGRVTTDFGDDDSGRGVAIQPDGKIVVVGHRGQTSSGPDVDFVIARYNVNGSLDDGSATDTTPADSFGTGGKVRTDFAGDEDAAQDVVIQPDGKIVVVGSRDFNGVPGFAVARYLPDGMPDTSFDTDGRVSTTFNGNAFGTAVALQSNGKIVVAGSVLFGVSGSNFVVARYNSNGSLDNTFGPNSNGRTFADVVVNGEDRANDLVLQSDGKIIAAGHTGSPFGNGANFALVRWLPNGSLDSSFGVGGAVTTIFGASDGALGAVIHGVALQSDGKIVAAGDTTDIQFNTGDVALARYVATPLNSSVLRVKSITFNGDIPTLTIDSHTGYTFKLQVAETLDPNAFTTFGAAQTGSNGTTLTFLGPPATPPSDFYRILVEPLNF